MIDLDGKTVVPGFTDSHLPHFRSRREGDEFESRRNNALENFVAKIKERVAKTERDKGSLGAVGSRLFGNL